MAFEMDFTEVRDRPPLQFKVDGDVFYAAPIAPAGALQDMAALGQLGKEGKVVEMMAKLDTFLYMVILPESVERFKERLRSPTEPITQTQVTKIVQWLMQEYAGRPTEPASSSQTGQVATGTSSMGGAPQAESPSDVWNSVSS